MTKVTPITECRQEETQVCGPEVCPIVKGERICRDVVKTVCVLSLADSVVIIGQCMLLLQQVLTEVVFDLSEALDWPQDNIYARSRPGQNLSPSEENIAHIMARMPPCGVLLVRDRLAVIPFSSV